MKKYERMEEIYESDAVPWDQTDPPPEVVTLAAQLLPGRATGFGLWFWSGCHLPGSSGLAGRRGGFCTTRQFKKLKIRAAQGWCFRSRSLFSIRRDPAGFSARTL